MRNACVNVGQGTVFVLGAQLEVYVRIRTMRARVKFSPEHASRAEPSPAIERDQVRLPLLRFGLEKQWQELLSVYRDCVKCR